jgi:hypothetical protein
MKLSINIDKLPAPNTRSCHLLVDVHLAGFAPAFTLSLGDSEYARKPQDAYSLSRQTAQKLKWNR